jgi:hypothetical protein
MDVFPVDGDVSQPLDHPAVHRPFELTERFHSPYKSGNVGREQWDVEQTRMIAHEKICLFRIDVFTPL